MKICLVAHRFYERNTHMMQFARALSERGDTVEVVAIGHPDFPKYERINGVDLFRIQSRTIDERGPIDYLQRTFLFLLKAMFFLGWRHVRERYDVIHVQSVPDFLVFAALLPKCLGAKVILDLRDLMPELYASKFGFSGPIFWLLKAIEKLSAGFADHIIVANPIWFERVSRRSAPRSKCSMFWYYPDTRLFHPQQQRRRNGAFRIIYPGSLNRHQGVDVAVRAFPEILRAIPEAELHIQGEGPSKYDLVRLATELGLTGRVLFHDYVPTTELLEKLAECDLGLVPKRGDRFGNEAASTKVSEFMAMGIPVVASRTAIEQCFFDDSLIRYFRAEDEADLAAAVVAVYQDSGLRDRLIAAGLRYTTKNSWQTKIREYLALVDALTSATRNTSRAVPLPALDSRLARGLQALPAAEVGRVDSTEHSASRPAAVVGSRRLFERYRLAEQVVTLACDAGLPQEQGFFKLGEDTICYGACSSGLTAPSIHGELFDAYADFSSSSGTVHLPFDPDQALDNLLLERYPVEARRVAMRSITGKAYGTLRPMMPVGLRKYLQRVQLRGWREITFPHWPVDCTVETIFERLLVSLMRARGLKTIPFIWFWPDGYDACAIVTHDVETEAGREFCSTLMDMDDDFGIKSSFQIIPQDRYRVTTAFLDEIRRRGFEINIHDLNHDGSLFQDERLFAQQMHAVNCHGREFGAHGFRAGSMYRNQQWYQALDFEYDMSVPNVAHLEPQRGGCCTVFPYFNGSLVELPLTTTQDYALFHFVREYGPELWQRQIDAIREKHGLITILVHPDYVREKQAQRVYQQLLERLASQRSDHDVWIPLPREVSTWWRVRNKLKLVADGTGWRIEGPGSERARIGYADICGDEITYRVAAPVTSPADTVMSGSSFGTAFRASAGGYAYHPRFVPAARDKHNDN